MRGGSLPERERDETGSAGDSSKGNGTSPIVTARIEPIRTSARCRRADIVLSHHLNGKSDSVFTFHSQSSRFPLMLFTDELMRATRRQRAAIDVFFTILSHLFYFSNSNFFDDTKAMSTVRCACRGIVLLLLIEMIFFLATRDNTSKGMYINQSEN